MNSPSVQEIVSAVTQGNSFTRAISLDLLADANRILATRFPIGRMKPLVVIYGFEAKKAVITYPLISKTHLNLSSDISLEQKDFTRILHEPEIIGNVIASSFLQRFREDRKPIVIAFLILVIACLLLAFSSHAAALHYSDFLSDPDKYTNVQNFVQFYQLIGQSLLTIMTLFLTVFVLFTISQNASIAKDANLYTHGLFHKYVRDDQYVSAVSTLSLVTAALGLLFTAIPHEIYEITFQAIKINKLDSLIPFLYSLSVAAFYISLTSLSYYAKRVITANESNLIKEILDKREETAQNLRNSLDTSQINDSGKDGDDHK